MLDSKNKILKTKFNLILTEKMNRNLININLWLQVSQKLFDFFGSWILKQQPGQIVVETDPDPLEILSTMVFKKCSV